MIQTSEKPHVYLWYIAETKQFYIGGNEALKPYYTHSSESSEELCSIIPRSTRPIAERKAFFENPPPGISRRILKEFDKITEENAKEIKNKVWKTENKFLLNRKERCWDRYYNVGIGNPFYVDQSGENNWNYKNGASVGRKSNDPEIRKAAEKKREQLPERKAYKREFDRSPQRKAYKSKWGKADYAKKKLERQGEGTLEGFLSSAEE